MVTDWHASGLLMYCIRSNDPANVSTYIEVDFRMSGILNRCSRHFFAAVGSSNIQRKKAAYSSCLRERKTGLGPATSTLARLRSTN